MLRNNYLFPLTHASNSATPTRIVHFYLELMIKLEFCVSKQRWDDNVTLSPLKEKAAMT